MATNMVGPQLDNKVRRFDEFFQHVFTFRLHFFQDGHFCCFGLNRQKRPKMANL